MSDYFFFFIAVMMLIAAILRADFVLTLIYLFLGVYFAGRWWSRKALSVITARRVFTQRAFLGEKVPVQIQIENPGWLPVVWLKIHESLPVELAHSGFYDQVISMGPKSQMRFELLLEGRKRGYYPIGPLSLYSGDVFGLAGDLQRSAPPDYLTVYPKIVPLSTVRLPSHSPLGTLRHTQPIFEDPSRVLGKRDYVAGDSLRRVDWKATATSGSMQVKIFEPSIALETIIFLNLNSSEYKFRTRLDAGELAIVVAASLANWVAARKQAVGLVTNGLDPLQEEKYPQPVPPRRGRSHLMRILDVLARIQMAETYPLVQLLQQALVHLSWGTTLILITPQIDESLFDELFHARRAGLDTILIPCGPLSGYSTIQQRASHFGFPLYHILNERDLDIWRQ